MMDDGIKIIADAEKQSGIRVKLVGENGNIFNLVGIAARALRAGGRGDLVNPMWQEVRTSDSYTEALAAIMKYVEAE